ncbi:MAG: hypothetical protein U0166_20465 [Acidobacteriota bacterium]
MSPFDGYPESPLLASPPPRELRTLASLVRSARRRYLLAWGVLGLCAVVLTAIIIGSERSQAAPAGAVAIAIIDGMIGIVAGIAWAVARSRARVVEGLLHAGRAALGHVTRVHRANQIAAAWFSVSFVRDDGSAASVMVDHNAGVGLYGEGSAVLVFTGDAVPGRAAVIVRMGKTGQRLEAFAGKVRA